MFECEYCHHQLSCLFAKNKHVQIHINNGDMPGKQTLTPQNTKCFKCDKIVGADKKSKEPILCG